MGLQPHLPWWKPLAKNRYARRLLTPQHPRLQKLKPQCTKEQDALAHCGFENEFIPQQVTKLLTVNDQQVEALADAIAERIEQHATLTPPIEGLGLVKSKGLARLPGAVLVGETTGFDGFHNPPHWVRYAG